MNKKRWVVLEFNKFSTRNENPGAWMWTGVPRDEFRKHLVHQTLKPILKKKDPTINVTDLDNYINWVVEDGYINQNNGQLRLSSKGNVFISKWYDWIKIKSILKLEDWPSNFIWLFLVAIFVVVIGGLLLAQLNSDHETKKYYFTVNNRSDNNSKLETVNCWVNSLSSVRPDAFRCMGNNYIYDPCFTDNNENIVSCPNNPADSKTLFYAVFDKSEDTILENRYLKPNTANNYPWYIKLYDGSECSFYTGATDLVAGMRVDYGCENQEEFLLLPIIEAGSLYKISCFKDNKIQQCDVKEAWY